MIRSSGANDFLNKSSVPTLVQDAIAKAQTDKKMKKEDEEKL